MAFHLQHIQFHTVHAYDHYNTSNSIHHTSNSITGYTYNHYTIYHLHYSHGRNNMSEPCERNILKNKRTTNFKSGVWVYLRIRENAIENWVATSKSKMAALRLPLCQLTTSPTGDQGVTLVIFLILLVLLTHDFVLQCDSKVADWQPFCCEKTPKKPDIEHVLNHFSDMHLLILLKLCTQIRNDGLHMHIILFRDQIKDGRLVAILLLNRVPNHFLNMHGPILFKLGRSRVRDGIHMRLTLFCDLIKVAPLVDWRPF